MDENLPLIIDSVKEPPEKTLEIKKLEIDMNDSFGEIGQEVPYNDVSPT